MIKLHDQFTLDLNHELIVDNFAGGGGASEGIYDGLGRHVDHAINHDRLALGMHRINHPQTVHHLEDVFDVDPAAIAGRRRVGFGWFSPDCKHFSKAKGDVPLDKHIRGLVLVMLRWAKIQTRVMSMENVEEIITWGPLLKNGRPDPRHKGRTWQAFLDCLSTGIDPNHPDLNEIMEVLGDSVTREELIAGFGYQYEARIIAARTLGAPTIRKRLYMIARCDGRPIIWPTQTHAEPNKLALGLKRERMIAECIDWDVPCPSIFMTKAGAKRYFKLTGTRIKRPLVKATMKRLATGVYRYVMKAKKPFLVNIAHGEVSPSGVKRWGKGSRSIEEPIGTLTGSNEFGVVDAQIAPFLTEHANSTHQRNFPADEPGRTQCGEVKGGHFALVAAHLARDFKQSIGQEVAAPGPTTMPDGQGKTKLIATSLVQFHGDSAGRPMDKPGPAVTANSYKKRPGGAPPLGLCAANLVKLRGKAETHSKGAPVTEPGHTVSAEGNHHWVSAAYLAQHNAGNNTNPGHPANEPASTISSKGSQQTVVAANLACYYGTERDGQGIDEPLRATTAKARFGLAMSEAVAPIMTEEHIAGALRVAKFLRANGIEFEGEYATVGGFVIVDIGMRMLQPRELFRAQGFREEYIIDRAWVVDPKTGEITEITLTKEQQIRMCGNSVCPDVAAAIARCNVPELATWYKGNRRQSRMSSLERQSNPC